VNSLSSAYGVHTEKQPTLETVRQGHYATLC